ncbi:MAG: 4-hydroxythreonine-4-phosphate dehydrogenase PdxA [Candidatus Firestonebacteria bacterium]|nr:4-hydroxythreonine-4-phosphate dehydrogenase PdxA [Candidatus Firestonebacteria bacterium]
MATPGKPRLIISQGDPAGVGPEIIAKALARKDMAGKFHPLVLGDSGIFKRALKRCGSRLTLREFDSAESAWRAPAGVLPLINPYPLAQAVRPGHWTPETGMASLAAVCLGVELAQGRPGSALVTAPICKEAWHAAGAEAPGHTELLAKLTGCKKFAMLFVGGPFRLVLATIHEPLARVPKLLTVPGLVQTAAVAVRELQTRFGIKHPRLAVAGFNPHAGEGGLFGDEEKRVIVPAIKKIRRLPGVQVEGPFAPDTLFAEAVKGRWDLLLCMYHDQGLIPFKLLALYTGVNVTAGLPIIRTSPDHGTAFDLAGTGRANEGSLAAALLTAADMARRQKQLSA